MRSPLPRRVPRPGGRRQRRSFGYRVLAVTTASALTMLGVALTGPTASAESADVSMQNLQYVPNEVTIEVGDSVTWTNNGTEPHSADGQGWQSPEIPPGGSFTRTFDSAGTYEVQCRFHPDMTMTVEVTEGGGSPTSTTTAPPPSSSTPPPSSTTPPPPSGGGGQTPDSEGGTVVGGGPLPVAFDLTDQNGAWYDTNVNLGPNIGQSLAVATLPRVKVDSVTGGIPRVDTEGLLDTGSAPSLLGDASVPLAGGGDLPLVGGGLLPETTATKALNAEAPAGAEESFNVDAMREAVDKLLPAGDPRAEEADALLDQFAEQVAAAPADQPLALSDLPVGPQLDDFLDNLRDAAENDITLPVTVNFNVAKPDAGSSHTATSLIWPEGAKGMPFDQSGAWIGSQTVQLTEPGLYAFACKVHPYMLGAVVVDDPITPGLDFGEKLRVASRGLNVPSNADIIMQLVQKFFVITNNDNWYAYSDSEERTWNPQFPPAPILTHDADGTPRLIPNLDSFFKSKFGFPKKLPALGKKPSVPGVGEVWIATQMEDYAEKTKHGGITKVDVQNWTVERKVSLPQVNMNNAHNMWTDKDEEVIYADEWFSDKTDVFDRETGEFIRQLRVGPSPTHVMTRTDTDQPQVAIGGGAGIVELAPGATRIDRKLPTMAPGEKIAHPHAQWMSGDGRFTVAPNVNTYDVTVIDNATGEIRKERSGEFPIATGMTPTASKAYIADFLGASISCISLAADACVDGGSKTHYKQIDLWGSYDPEFGGSGPFGGLPIQLAVSPDNSALIGANTLSSNLTVIDPATDEIVKYLPCDAGCHGVNYGAKKGGGYYAYVSSKFTNALTVVDPDPNGDGDPSDAAVVGKFVLDSDESTAGDGTISEFDGFGGQGVLPIPLAYEGWVQRIPDNAVNSQLTCRQRNPVDFATQCP